MTAKRVAGCLGALLDRHMTVVIDLTEVGFIDSVGLLVLYEARIRAQREGKALSLRRPVGHVAKVLGLTRMDEMLEFDR